MRLLPLALAIACSDKSAEPLDDTAPVTDDTGDSGEPAVVEPVITGSIVLPEGTARSADITVGVVHVRFGWGPKIESTLVSAVVADDGSFTLALPDEPLGVSIYSVEDDPDLDGATYLLIAFEDTDKDGAFTEGEPWLGAPLERLVVFLEESAALPTGWAAGWSLVDSGLSGIHDNDKCALDRSNPLTFRESGGFPVFSAITDPVQLPLPGLPATLTMSGTVDGFSRMGVFDYMALQGYADTPLMADVDADGSFTLTLSEAPSEDSFLNSDPDSSYALGVPLAYTDTDSSGSYSDKDTLSNVMTCLDGEDAMARYSRPVSTWRGWRVLECYGGNTGWKLVTESIEGGWREFRTSAEATSLHVADGECHW